MIALPKWWTVLLRGIVAILFGIVILVWPQATTLALIYVFGAFVLIEGLFAIAGSLYGIAGVASIIIGIIFFIFPGVGIFTIILVIGIYAIALGIMLIGLSFMYRGALEGLAVAT